MKRTLIVVVLTALVVVAVLVLGAVVVATTGLVDVAVGAADPPGLEWFLHETMETSVARRAAAGAAAGEITPPSEVTPELLERGFVSYQEMCVTCHGAPGVERSETGLGLYPQGPDLAEESEMSPEETFWVVKNGIRHTGMPAYGETHSDQALWEITMFVERLAELSAEGYERLARQTGVEPADSHTHAGEDEEASAPGAGDEGEGEAGHEHDHGAQPHEH